MTDFIKENSDKGSSAAPRHLAVAAALTTFERPVGFVTGYVVTCDCGWESRVTTDWRKSLDNHWAREAEKRGR